MKIKLIAFDMDGTLLDEDHKISEETIRILHKVQDEGIRLALITGRVYISVKKYKEVYGLKASIASTNGACVFNENDKKIYNAPIDKDKLNLAIDLLRESGMYFHLYPIDGLITPYGDNPSATNRKRMPEGYDDLLRVEVLDWDELKNIKEEIYKIIIIDEDDKKRLAFRETLKKHGINNSSSWINNIEITSALANKKIAIEKIAEEYGVDLNEVVAFGDNENDLLMLNSVGRGFLMGNAPSNVKSQTNVEVIGKNTENGIYHKLREIL